MNNNNQEMHMSTFSNEDKEYNNPHISSIPRLSHQIQSPQDNRTSALPSSITQNPLSLSNSYTYHTINSLNNTITPQVTTRQSIPSSSIEIDKDKLYETFILFQNFMNMTNAPQEWKDVSNPNTNRDKNLQDKIDMINLTQSPEAVNNNTSPLPQKEQNDKNYDDRPIKCNNVDFRDLVDKMLANDNNNTIEEGNNMMGKTMPLISSDKGDKGQGKKKIKKSKTKEAFQTIGNKQNRTYQKPFYSTRSIEGKKGELSARKTMVLHKQGDGFGEKEYSTPSRKVMSNMKYDQINKSLRKSNTDVFPYTAALTQENNAFPSNAVFKEMGECSNIRMTTEANSETVKDEPQVIHVNKTFEASMKSKGNKNKPGEEAKQKENTNEECAELIEMNNNALTFTHMKKEESFPIITDPNTINNEDDNQLHHHPNYQSNEVFSNDEEEQIHTHPSIISPNNNNTTRNKQDLMSNQEITNQCHIRQTPSLEIEPTQSNTIPISSKLFDSTSIQHTKDNEKIQEELHQEILIFQEERRKVTILKEEYEKLHHRLETELDELTIHKTQFTKWREEETKRIQKDKKQNDQYKKVIAELRRENQLLRLKESQHKGQIELLTHRLKEMEKELKEKECMRQLNLTNNRPSIQLGGELSPLAASTGSSNNKYLPATTKQIKPPNTLYQSHNSSHGHTLNHSNRNFKQRLPNEMSFSSTYNNINTHSTATPNQSTSLGIYNPTTFLSSSTTGTTTARKSAPKTNLKKSQTVEPKKESYDFIIPNEYLNKQYDLIKQEKTPEGKEIKWFTNDKREILFVSGVRKEIFGDGYQVVSFPNGDMKQIYQNGMTVYYFKEAKTVQTSYDDGLQVFKFDNGQIEKHFIDGKKEIYFPDGSYRLIRVDGSEDTFYSDGTIQKIDANNVMTVEHEGDVSST